MDLDESARLVRELRERLDLTQEQFAQRIGVTYSTVNHWENGKRNPQPFLLERLKDLESQVLGYGEEAPQQVKTPTGAQAPGSSPGWQSAVSLEKPSMAGQVHESGTSYGWGLPAVRQWVQKAENDLRAATFVLTMEKDCPTDTVCFHAQQCVEKFLKAQLTFLEIPHPPTSDIEVLFSLLPSRNRPGLGERDQQRLTRYATVTPYPGDYEPISIEEARTAIEIARRIRDSVRNQLPAEGLESSSDTEWRQP